MPFRRRAWPFSTSVTAWRAALWSRPRALLALLVAAAVAVRLPFLLGGQIDYDEGVYWLSLRSLAAGHGIFVPTYSSQPPLFLAWLLPFHVLSGGSVAAVRCGILVMAVAGMVATWSVARSLLGPAAGRVAALVSVVDPLGLRQSVTVQADGPATALGTVMLALLLDAGRREGRSAAVERALAGAALAAAVLTKVSAVVFVVPALWALLLGPRGGVGMPAGSAPTMRDVAPRGGAVRALRDAAAVVAGAVVAAALVLAPFLPHLSTVLHQVVGGHVAARGLHEGGLTSDMVATLLREAPLGLAALAGTALLLLRRSAVGVLLVAWAAAVAAFALAQRPLWPHHLVLVLPLMALGVAGTAATLRWPRARAGAARVAGLVLAAAGLLVVGAVALRSPVTADTVAGAPELLRHVTSPGDLVVGDDQWAVAAAGRDSPPELVDTSYVRLDSEPVTAADVEAVILREHVRAVDAATGRLAHLRGLLDWVRSRAVARYRVGAAEVDVLSR